MKNLLGHKKFTEGNYLKQISLSHKKSFFWLFGLNGSALCLKQRCVTMRLFSCYDGLNIISFFIMIPVLVQIRRRECIFKD